MIKNGDALLSIYANDPDAFKGMDPERVAALQRTQLENNKEIGANISRNAINWCVVASASPAWAAKILRSAGRRNLYAGPEVFYNGRVHPRQSGEAPWTH